MDLTYMTCAYDKTHQVNPLKFNTHQTRCRERYLELCEKDGVAVEIFICKWDSTHHIHISALEHHEENCVEKRLVPIHISAPWGAKTKENDEDDGEDVIIPVRGGPDIPRAYDPANKDKWRVNTIGFNTKLELWNRCPGSKNPQKCKTDKPQQRPQSGYSGGVPNLKDGNTTSSTTNAEMEMDRRMVCAYDKRHLVSPTDFIAHQDKCRDRYVEQQKRCGRKVEIVICKWSSSHHVHISVLEKHEDICSAKPVAPTDSDARLSAHIQEEKRRCENTEDKEQIPVARGRGTRIEYRAIPRSRTDYRGVPVLTHQPEANPTLEQVEVAQVEAGTNDTIQELEASEAETVQQLGDLSLESISVQRTFPYIHRLSETLRYVDQVPTPPSYPYSRPVEPELEPDITSEEQAMQTKGKTEEDETAYARESLALLERTAKWVQESKEPSRPFEDRGSTISLSSRLYCPSDVSFGEGYDEW